MLSIEPFIISIEDLNFSGHKKSSESKTEYNFP